MPGAPTKREEAAGSIHASLLRYRVAVRGYLGRRTSSATDADDLTQEVFARILRRAESGPIENVEGYIFQTATNLLRERARQAGVRAATPAIDLAAELIASPEQRTPERILMGREAHRRLIMAIQELPERTRAVFVLNRFEEVKGPEIARRLGISISAVEKHMIRAIAHLRQSQQ